MIINNCIYWLIILKGINTFYKKNIFKGILFLHWELNTYIYIYLFFQPSQTTVQRAQKPPYQQMSLRNSGGSWRTDIHGMQHVAKVINGQNKF